MLRLAKFSIRRPWVALAIWLVFAGALTAIGTGVAGSFSPSKIVVPGTESSKAQKLAEDQFGPSTLVPIMLTGPKAQIDRQGPTLVALLGRRNDTRVMSAWDAGSTGAGLRPKPTAAMIVASVAQTEKDMVKTYQAQIEQTVRQTIRAPVTAHVSGQPSVDRAMKTEAVNATRTAMYIAIPILFLLLFIGLRAPVAAAVIAGLAATTIGVGYGVMALVGKVIEVDALAVALAAITGLTLSVGYALMIAHRFREAEAEFPGGTRHDSALAAARTVSTVGRAVLFGGTAMVVTMILSAALSSNVVLTSVGVGAVICATLGIGAAVVVLPALLVLMGQHLHAFSFPAPAPLARAWNAIAIGGGGLVQRTALFAGFAATAVLAVMAIPALSLNTGPPGIANLPKDNAARQSFETINATMGAGWATPYNIVVVSKQQPITSVSTLKQIDTFQRQILADKRVASVVGPGEFRAQTKDLGKLPKSLKDSAKLLKGGKKDLGRLENGLGQAGAGAVTLQQALRTAASGADQLHSGSGDAQAGAGKLHAGLAAARSGALQISGGLGQALAGANALKAGAAKALSGSKQITGGLGQAAPTVKNGLPLVQDMARNVAAGSQAVDTVAGQAQSTTNELDQALASLQSMQTGKNDPAYSAALRAVESARGTSASVTSTLGGVQGKMQSATAVSAAFATQVGELSAGLQQLLAGSTALTNGIGQLSQGNADLAAGINKLNGGGGQLTGGLTQLRDGAGALQNGLGLLTAGTGQLGSGLAGGVGPVGTLAAGLTTMQTGVAKFQSNLPSPKDLEKLNAQSPGLFDSGYFVLAAIAGAPAASRNLASFAVNLGQGGTAGQIVVIGKRPPSDTSAHSLGNDLSAMAKGFSQKTGMQVAVGGPAGQVGDFQDEIGARIWVVVGAVAVVIALMMMLMLRTVVLPLVAVAFDLLTCAATFGVVKVVFGGSDPILGGPGYLDPASVIMTFAAVFGLTMVYEVYLLEQSREHFVKYGDAADALRHGLKHTAAAATGVGIAGVAIAIPFLASDMINLKQAGVGIGVAVLLDTLIVRPVLLPAAMAVLGRRAWWPTTHQAPPPPAGEAPPSNGHRTYRFRRPKKEPVAPV